MFTTAFQEIVEYDHKSQQHLAEKEALNSLIFERKATAFNSTTTCPGVSTSAFLLPPTFLALALII